MDLGHDLVTQNRSAIYYVSEAQQAVVEASRGRYAEALKASGFGPITTEVAPLGDYWFAEEYHQQYLEKNPGGYCGLGGTGVSCPIGILENG